MKEQALRVSETERLLGSSEVLESIIRKYKTMQGEQGQFGATSMLLGSGAFVGRLTVGGIRMALQTIQGVALSKWEKINLGSTIQSQRKQAFPSPKRGIETGSNQLALTGTNGTRHPRPVPFGCLPGKVECPPFRIQPRATASRN